MATQRSHKLFGKLLSIDFVEMYDGVPDACSRTQDELLRLSSHPLREAPTRAKSPRFRDAAPESVVSVTPHRGRDGLLRPVKAGIRLVEVVPENAGNA